MLKSLAWALAVIVPVALVTGIIVFARASAIAEPQKIAALGLGAVARQDGATFATLALLFGLVAGAVYASVWPRWHGVTALYVAAAVILGIGLSVAAAVLRTRFGLGGVPEVIALNLLWAAAFGWLAPAVIRSAQVDSPRALYEAEIARAESAARADSTGALRRRDVSSLPEPMQRYFRRIGLVGEPAMTSASLEFKSAAMRRTRTADWAPVRFEQQNFVFPPTRLVHIRSESGLLRFEGRDAYFEGRGNMFIRVGGLLTVADMKGAEMDRAALVTFLAELPFLPSACLEPYVQWRALDLRRVEALLTHGGRTVRGVFEVEENGEISSFTTDDRYMIEGKRRIRARWTASMSDYAQLDGLWLPTRVTATWHLPEGDFEYARARVGAVKYVQPAGTTSTARPPRRPVAPSDQPSAARASVHP